MIKKILSLIIAMSFFSACASTSQISKGPAKPKPFVTPWEYYQNSRPANFTPEDEAKVQKAAVHTMGEDTRSDKTHYIIIGVVVGVVVIGGTVAGILLTR